MAVRIMAHRMEVQMDLVKMRLARTPIGTPAQEQKPA